MRRPFSLLMLAALAISPIRTVSGQVCLGYAPFSSGPVRASVGYQDGPRQDQYRGELGYGFSHSDFGVLGLQHTAPRNIDGGYSFSSNLVDGRFGHEFSLTGSSGKLCPIGRLGYYSSSSTFVTGNSSTAHGLTYDFGGAFGFNATDGPTHIVPSLAVQYFGSASNGTVTVDGTRQSVSFAGPGYAQWTLALGVQAHGVTIAPYINGRFSRGGVGGFWGVNAAINFGSVRH